MAISWCCNKEKFFDRAVFLEHVATDLADVAAVDMDADGGLVAECVPDLVHIANARRHGVDVTCFYALLPTAGQPAALCVLRESLRQFGATQHAQQAPHGVVVDGGGLAGAPDKTHHRKTVFGVGIEQVLLITLGVGLRKLFWQPVVLRQQL